MKRTHWIQAAATLLVLAATAPLAWTAPVPTEKSALSWIPADAPLVVHLNGLESLRDHVVAFLKNAVPDRADYVQAQADEFLKNGVAGRKPRGLAKNGPIFAVFTEMPKPEENPPHLAIILAVTNYAEFRDNILTENEKKNLKRGDGYESTPSDMGETIFLVDKKDYAVLTPRQDVAIAFAKGGPGLDGKMSKAQGAKLLHSDLGVYLAMDVFNKEYADQIKAAHEAADEQIKTLENTVGKAQQAQFDLLKKMVGPTFQAVEDSKSLLGTLEVRPGGVAWHMQTELRPGTPTADALKDSKKSAFKDIDKLPAGEVFYIGMDLSPEMLKTVGSFVTGMTADPESKGAKELTEAFAEWSKAGPSQTIAGVKYPVSGVSVLKCAEPEKALAAAIKMVKALGTEGTFENARLKEKPQVKEKAEKYKDIEFTSFRMVFDWEKSMEASGKELPEAARKGMVEGMKKLMGDSLNTWSGVEGKELIQVNAKDWASAEKLLDQYFKGVDTVGAEKSFVAARKELPNEATFLAEMDVVQYTAVILEFMKPMLEATAPAAAANIPKPIRGEPGYVGMALTLAPERGGFDLVVSSDAVKQIYQGYISPLLPKGD